MQERENYKLQIHDLKARCEDRKERVDDERRKFMDFKKHVALNALNSRSGRPIPPKVSNVWSCEVNFQIKVIVMLFECKMFWYGRMT